MGELSWVGEGYALVQGKTPEALSGGAFSNTVQTPGHHKRQKDFSFPSKSRGEQPGANLVVATVPTRHFLCMPALGSRKWKYIENWGMGGYYPLMEWYDPPGFSGSEPCRLLGCCALASFDKIYKGGRGRIWKVIWWAIWGVGGGMGGLGTNLFRNELGLLKCYTM